MNRELSHSVIVPRRFRVEILIRLLLDKGQVFAVEPSETPDVWRLHTTIEGAQTVLDNVAAYEPDEQEAAGG